ncbi:MAG: hypothetical protein HXS48_15770 [Theionarchaea archaeon]|nr:hypothetical protein [Theionarchaea archaeon]
MTLKIGLSSRSPEEYEKLEINGLKIETMRGKAEEKVIELSELLESLNEEIRGHITEPCDVTVEIDGGTTYHSGGGITALIVDVSGKIEKTSGMKISLKFKVYPKK